ncbi:plasmid stabilization protein [Brachybacterium sp. AOP3-A1-3]|uniref:plasmid stabilization protein n=1 Tax=Brachybacterium sp. AOP3-A1-3 TaxID=3457699 RepID=UPI004034552D
MPDAWSAKRERQYEHVKEGLQDKGRSEDEAEEIAARTVNKTRAQEGESEEASRTSLADKSPAERGGEHSHSGPQGRTKDQLYEDARRQGVEGRSSMDKAELKDEVEKREDR